MKRYFTALSFFLFPLFLFSQDGDVTIPDDGDVFLGLKVEWISANEIRIAGGTLSGGNEGNSTYTVITNFFGECTNCVNIAPEELRLYKFQVIDLCESIKESSYGINNLADEIMEICTERLQEIARYVRYNLNASTATSVFTNYYNEIIRQDYDFSYIHGKQGELTYDYFNELMNGSPTFQNNANKRLAITYSNGIYDYSTSVEGPTLNQIKAKVSEISTSSSTSLSPVQAIERITNALSDDACQCAGGSCDPGSGGGGSGGGGSGDCPCREQLEALQQYTSHIDDDLHRQYQELLEMKQHLGSIDRRLKSYSEAMVSVFLNNGTIVVDTGANSWTSVYSNGYSELYEYNRSNILQRIELLLYGLAFSSSSSSTNDISDLSSSYEDSKDSIDRAGDDALSTIGEAAEGYTEDIGSLESALEGLWRNLNFLGSGQLQNFALMEPMRVFDEYDLEFEFTRSADFSDLRTIVRTSFQVFYLLGMLVFIVVFWLKVVRFTYDKTLFVLDFFNKVLT